MRGQEFQTQIEKPAGPELLKKMKGQVSVPILPQGDKSPGLAELLRRSKGGFMHHRFRSVKS